MPPLSIIFLTTGKQPLLWHSLSSLLPQIEASDFVAVSVNSSDEEDFKSVEMLLHDLDTSRKVKLLRPGGGLSVYEHYRFAIDSALTNRVLIAHDDEIYNSKILDELRIGFSRPEVTVVVGGMLMAEPFNQEIFTKVGNNFETSSFRDGAEWIKTTDGLYPRFCFSALAITKDRLNSHIFSKNSTAADCLAVTQQALKGQVYTSGKIFATWLQLPSRNSRWYILRPGLIAPWKEYMDYFISTGDQALVQKGLAAKKKSLGSFVKILFAAAVRKRDPVLIAGAFEKIHDINKYVAAVLSPIKYPIFYIPLSMPIRGAFWIHRFSRHRKLKKNLSPEEVSKLLGIDPAFWQSYSEAVIALPK